MRLKRKAIAEYPFHGIFYTVITKKPEDGDLLGNGGLLDGDLLGGEDTDGSLNAKITEKNEGNTETLEETILLETECDIQQASKIFNGGTIMADRIEVTKKPSLAQCLRTLPNSTSQIPPTMNTLR